MNFNLESEVLTVFLEGRLDTESIVKFDVEVVKLCSEQPHTSLVFDAANLSYIASSGLRIMLKYAKTEKNFSIVNVIPQVYSVFEMTGFTKIINISKALRRINLDNCEVIGRGGNGAVYRISEDEIVKVNYMSADLDSLTMELTKAKEAFLLGVPTAISFDMVDCGDGRRGVVYETIKCKSVGETIQQNPERLEELVEKYVAHLKALHSIHTDNPNFGESKDVYRSQIEKTVNYVTEEEAAMLYKMLDAIPGGDVLVHGDAHPKNVMIQGEELTWIDMEMMGVGHPICDLISIAVVTKNVTNEELAINNSGMTLDTLKKFNECFLRKYFNTEDPEEIAKYDNIMEMLRLVRMVFVIGHDSPHTVLLRPRIIEAARQHFFPRLDQIIAGVKYLASLI